MMRIEIKKFTDKSRVRRKDGKKLRKIVEEFWNAEKFELDFSYIAIASVSFLDEVFGKLALEHSTDELRKKIKVKNITDYDRGLINDIIRSRSRQRENGIKRKKKR